MSSLNHLQVAWAHFLPPNSPTQSPSPHNLPNQSNVGLMNLIVEAAILNTNFTSYMWRYNHPVATSKNTPPVLPPTNSVNTTYNKEEVCADGASGTQDDDYSNAEDFIFNNQNNFNSDSKKISNSPSC